MRAFLLVALVVLACATACGGAVTRPTGGVLVYAKPNAPLAGYTGHHEDVWVAQLDGSRPWKLTSGVQPSVSPDGRLVAFGSGSQVLLESTQGGPAAVLYTIGGRWPVVYVPPVWAPDSEHLAIEVERGRLLVVDVVTRQRSLLPATQSFSFSPDSRRIVYEARGDLYVIPTMGGTPRQLTHDGKDVAPVWGKSGIAFTRFRTRSHTGDIWLMDAGRTRMRRLTHSGVGFAPAFFSADGTRLLAAIPPSHNGQLWAVDVRTGKARAITPLVGDLNAEGLSSDGKTVLASVGCGGMVSPYGYVETIPFTGGKPHVIARGPCRASWNPG
jgi:Tol biopolymer transport system component